MAEVGWARLHTAPMVTDWTPAARSWAKCGTVACSRPRIGGACRPGGRGPRAGPARRAGIAPTTARAAATRRVARTPGGRPPRGSLSLAGLLPHSRLHHRPTGAPDARLH